MADRISDNVGKKIVEALKMQNNETVVSPEDSLIDSPVVQDVDDFDTAGVSDFINGPETISQSANVIDRFAFNASDSDIDNAFNRSLNNNLSMGSSYTQPQIDFELPNNVAILNRLIAKLPVGVSKQTGATIISQTMEALGISMNSVIQEAKEVQDTLTNNARECQKAIIDYRKQISELEIKAQQFQRQAVTMNDVINLFTRS